MNAKEQVKHILIDKNKKLKDLAEEMNMTQPNLSQKLSRNTIKYSEMLEIAKILNYEIIWKEKNTEYAQELTAPTDEK